VHVRKQRPGEAHVSTREGITPVKPDDLIMRGVSGEEYPIGRAIFEQTYSLDTNPPAAQPDDPTGQAPCVRHCESTAYEIVIRGLKGDIERDKKADQLVSRLYTPAAQRTWVGSGDLEDSNAYQTPPAAQPAQERNFCARCGKRTKDLTTIHTCTPPQEKNT
jgi:hypothetical protein